ncbi:alanine--tRNA ligase [Gudongella sp. DL1XJH-153]|uniref:alanine--tRNA ligase n=1 Tax=Gudongella sp. DL1XJH-153 TaxID=3409804 RepID=UPI003BB7DF96
MKKLGLHEIRKEYLDFFKEKDHLVAPSFSLVPKNDKSLLLIGAGMAPLKPYFTGDAVPPHNRMVTCQKCIRTGDIENVGRTARHATFFEMLGNFSFGDYFKKEAVAWAWEFLTERMEIDPELLWVSVYYEDDEAYDIWKDDIGVPEEKIVRLGKEDNFWELEVGPSGPCSEIYIDRGESFGCGHEDCKPGCDCDRFLEVWNLVFTQFDKDEKGVYHPLSNPNIDTGMGLERIAAIMEDVNTIFDIGAINDILRKAEEISGYEYGTDLAKDVSVRLITDHTRAMTFLVSDGVIPGNEGRGYVLRRLIRRAARHGKLLGIEEGFLHRMAGVVIDSWQVEYNELKENEVQIKKIIKAEEEKFQETINAGLSRLEDYINEMKKSGAEVFSGEKAFKLYDTYGFPLELTEEILEEKEIELDKEEFKVQMEAQRQRARSARSETDGGWGGNDDELTKGIKSAFKGYLRTTLESKPLILIKEGERVSLLSEGEEGHVMLKETPFYGEQGGQVGDRGTFTWDGGKASVHETKLTHDGEPIHFVEIIEGHLKEDTMILAKVDDELRDSTRRNHSATHLLHKALKTVLGNHVNQAGSLVMPNRLRFDFTHFEAISKENLQEIEELVNRQILRGLPVLTKEESLKEAQEQGVTGLFEGKYGETVRVVSMGDYSQELCGGTHVTNTGQIGLFKIVSEGGIASGTRRIEALTGINVYHYLNHMEEELDEVASIIKANRQNLKERAKGLLEESKEKDRQISKMKDKLSANIADEILSQATEIKGIKLITHISSDLDMNGLRNLGDELKARLGSGVVVLVSTGGDKVSFVAMATKDVTSRGVHSGNIVKAVATATGGSGGGRPEMAQAGGKDKSKLAEAMDSVEGLLADQIK